MIYSLICSMIYILLTIALIMLVHKIIALDHREEVPVLYIGSEDDAESIEVKLRIMMLEYPSSEIYIEDCGASEEAVFIAEKLSQDYPQLHIKKSGDV